MKRIPRSGKGGEQLEIAGGRIVARHFHSEEFAIHGAGETELAERDVGFGAIEKVLAREEKRVDYRNWRRLEKIEGLKSHG